MWVIGSHQYEHVWKAHSSRKQRHVSKSLIQDSLTSAIPGKGCGIPSLYSTKLLFIYRTSGIQLHSRPHPIEAGVDLVVTCLRRRLTWLNLVVKICEMLWRGNGGEPRKLLVQKSPKSVGLQRIRFHPKPFCAGIKCSLRNPKSKGCLKYLFVYCFVTNSNQAISTGKPLAPPWLSAPDSDQNLWTRGKQWCTASQNSSVSSKGPELHDKVCWNLLRNGETP